MTMSEPVVLCVATDGYDAVWRFCIDSQAEYCRRHGFEYRLATSTADGLNGKWTKLVIARDLLEAGRDVLVIDADAEFDAGAPPFTAAMTPTDKSIFVALGISGRPNSGVIMLRGAPQAAAVRFLDHCLEQRHRPVPSEDFVTTDGENGHVIHALKNSPHANALQVLDTAWNCTRPERAETAYIKHYTNLLRADLEAGAAGRRLALPIALRDADEARRRAAYLLHQTSRSALVNYLNANADALDRLRRVVAAAAGDLTFPRLAVNDGNAWIWRYEFVTGLLELPTLTFLDRIARPGGTFLDGGAHVGYFARHLLLATRGEQRVVAVEAHPGNMAICTRNLRGFEAHLIEAALVAHEAPVDLMDGTGHSNSTIYKGGPASGRVFKVQGRSIDGIFQDLRLEQIDLAKIDVEGAEPLALTGAANVLARSPEAAIVLESNPALLKLAGFSPLDLVRLMASQGFYGRVIREDFALGPLGYVPNQGTVNIAFARPDRWATIKDALASANI